MHQVKLRAGDGAGHQSLHPVERRGHVRVRCHIQAQIAVNGVTVCDCVIRNVSRNGAHVIVPASTCVPGAFEIAGLFDGAPVKARRVWRHAEEMGVCFLFDE